MYNCYIQIFPCCCVVSLCCIAMFSLIVTFIHNAVCQRVTSWCFVTLGGILTTMQENLHCEEMEKGKGEVTCCHKILSQSVVTKCCQKCCHKILSKSVVTKCCHEILSKNVTKCFHRMHYAVRFKMCSICCVQCIVPSRYWLFVYFVSLPLTLFIPRPLLYLTSISPLLQIQDRMLLVTESLSKKLNVLSPKCQKNLMHRCRREKVWPATAGFFKSHILLCLSLIILHYTSENSVFSFFVPLLTSVQWCLTV